MATCVDVAGATYPKTYAETPIQPMEGKSLVSVFHDDSLPARHIFFEHEGNGAIRQGDWKLILDTLGSGGWPGEPSACIAAGDCSCEAFSEGPVVQPVNTLSSLVFVVAGFALLLRATAGRLLSRVYAVLVMFLGVGSAAFHASSRAVASSRSTATPSTGGTTGPKRCWC